jgi:hypothetical protein
VEADDLLPVPGRSCLAHQRGSGQQIAEAEKAVAWQPAVKENRFIQLTGGTAAST